MYNNISIFVPSEETISRRRFLNWLGGIAILPVVSTRSTYAQEFEKFELGDEVCDYIGESEIPESVHLFASDQEAEAVIAKISELNTLPARFEVRAGAVPNAAAVIRGGKRYILYNQTFMHRMTQRVGTHWAPRSIMAHEVGHHLGSHTLEPGNEKRHQFELEADRFSGGVLRKWGASLEEAQAAMKAIGSDHGSSTHPAKRDRLAAIASGWTAADAPPSEPDPGKCTTANDGVCDEGTSCPVGTDTADCNLDSGNPDPGNPDPGHPDPGIGRPASACCNPYTGQPVCPMVVPLPRGVPCHCGGYPGGLTCY